MLIRRVPLAVAAAAGALVLAACNPLGGEGPEGGYYVTPGEGGEGETEDGEASGEGPADGETVSVALNTAEGEEVGTVTLAEGESALTVRAELAGLPPGGFHGFHVHETGLCEPDSAAPGEPNQTGAFLSAGGHLASGDQQHGEHDGDMPSPRVLSDGSALLELELDSVSLEDLMDDDGSAFMLHAGPDNFANIPERYDPSGPDEETLATGDSGDRIACGVVEPGE